MKTCPYCAEQIQDAAIVCRFCGREVTPATAPESPRAPPTASSSPYRQGLLPAAVVAVLGFIAMATTDSGPVELLLDTVALFLILWVLSVVGMSIARRLGLPYGRWLGPVGCLVGIALLTVIAIGTLG